MHWHPVVWRCPAEKRFQQHPDLSKMIYKLCFARVGMLLVIYSNQFVMHVTVRTCQIGLTERLCKSASVKHWWGHAIGHRTSSWWFVKLASDISSWYAMNTLTWRSRLIVNESRDVGIFHAAKRWPSQEFDWSPHRNMPNLPVKVTDPRSTQYRRDSLPYNQDRFVENTRTELGLMSWYLTPAQSIM